MRLQALFSPGPLDGQAAAAGVHIDPRVEPAQPDARHHRCTGTGSAGQGFARVTLVHPQLDLAAREHLQKSGIHPARKARV